MKCLQTVVLLGVLAVPAWAQDSGDEPEHGVARISLLKGDVTVRRGDSGELVAAELNAPLVALDHVLTEADSRVEIQFDWANMARLAPYSEVRLAELADRDFLIQVDAGTMTFRVLRDSKSQVEISTPTASVRPQREGTYRITVRDDNSTEVTVRSGEAEVYAGGKTDLLRVGQTLVVRGDPSDPQIAYRAALPRDEWDRWNESRDRDLDRNDSYKYVSRDIYGAEDLGGYGRWVYDAPYGWVWVPRVDSAWAPYRVGRWSWVNYYGWTWVSGDPWGWAPYHYGRWYHAPRYGWVWYPGEVQARYYWRPGLVAFFGWGTNVGWVALAPREVYRPWYGRNRSVFVNNVTVVNNINVVNTYRNARFISGRSGVTSVVNGDFGRRNTTVRNFIAGNDRDFARAGDAGRWLQREPSRENRQFSDRPVSPRSVARRDVPREFVTRPGRNDRNDHNGRDSRDSIVRVQPNSTPQSARRADAPQRSESVVSPRSQQDRNGQPEGSRGRGQASGGAVASTGSDARRGSPGDAPRRNETVVAPRSDSTRDRQPQNNRAREEAFVRQPQRQAEARPDRSAESFRRTESSVPSAAPGGAAPGRGQQSVRSSVPDSGPGRSAPQGRVRSADAGPGPVASPRQESRNNGPEPQGRVRSADAGPGPVAPPRQESRSNGPEPQGRVRSADASPGPAASPRQESRSNAPEPQGRVRSADATSGPVASPRQESRSNRSEPQASSPGNSEGRSRGRGGR